LSHESPKTGVQACEQNDNGPSRQAVCPLCDLCLGESGVITRLSLQMSSAELLESFGFVQGARVIAEQSAPQGDPKICRLDGRLIAVRRQDALGILVVRGKE